MTTEIKYRVTRFCCTSGMCLTCRAVANGRRRHRIVHADNVSKELAEKMLLGWVSYEPKMEPMTEGEQR